tara:strand:- start:5020 stop:5145 length:126 start_codon:yes stop_codon:yes gene_type:complete
MLAAGIKLESIYRTPVIDAFKWIKAREIKLIMRFRLHQECS